MPAAMITQSALFGHMRLLTLCGDGFVPNLTLPDLYLLYLSILYLVYLSILYLGKGHLGLQG